MSESFIPKLAQISREQVWLTGGTLLTTGIADLALHGGTPGIVVGLAVSVFMARHSKDILDSLVPGRDVTGTMTARVVDAVVPEPSYADQSAGAKVRRLFNIKAQESDYARAAQVVSERGRETEKGEIDLSPDIAIARSDLVGKAIFVCGIRRHGKTTLGARLAEQLSKYYIPLFIPDVEGDYLSLADVLPRAVVAGHSSADIQYQHYDFAALDDVQAAYQLGYNILEQGYQVILDMMSYASLDAAVSMQINVIRGMFKWANSHPQNRVPSHVFLDEAQRYLPQTLSDSVIADKVIVSELLRVYMDIIAIGGKRGIAPIILTQRLAQVNKKIMAQSEVFFLMRQTNDNDLDRCMEYVNAETATREEVSKFKPGQGVYISTDGVQVVTQFRDRESSGARSSTPQVEAASRYVTMPMHHTGELSFAEHSAATKKLAPSVTKEITPSTMEELQPTLEARARKAYDEGYTTIDRLCAVLKSTPHYVRPILAIIKAEKGIK